MKFKHIILSLVVLLSTYCCAVMPGTSHYSFYNPSPVVGPFVKNSAGQGQTTFYLSPNIQGYVSNISGVPTGITHQPRITFTINSSSTTQNGPSVSPATNVNFTANFSHVQSSGGKESGQVTEAVLCTLTAANFIAFVEPVQFEVANTRVLWNGGTQNCSWGPTSQVEYCDYKVIPWCTPYTTPPDYNLSLVHDEFYPVSWDSWDAYAGCFQVNGSGLWVCTPGVAIELTQAGQPAPPFGVCTKN